jgi:hypothetical protein
MARDSTLIRPIKRSISFCCWALVVLCVQNVSTLFEGRNFRLSRLANLSEFNILMTHIVTCVTQSDQVPLGLNSYVFQNLTPLSQ